MTTTQAINKILGISDSYQAPNRIMDILYGDIETRDKVFAEFLELFKYNMWDDWFHEYFQDEHADRREKKQDFTPSSVSELLTQLVGSKDKTGCYYEPAVGTGGIMIKRWQDDITDYTPWDYEPRFHYYHVEDLSDRAFPFLLFNMIIRGMNGVAVHCDVLTRQAYGAFFIQNDYNDHMKYSSLNLLPYNKATESELNIKFVDKRYKPIKQTKDIPMWLGHAIEEERNAAPVVEMKHDARDTDDRQMTLFDF